MTQEKLPAQEEKPREVIGVEVFKPGYPVGQVIYVPGRNGITESKINAYEVQVFKEKDKLVGVVSNYRINHFVLVRRGTDSQLLGYLKERDFYTNKEKAEAASRFLEVKADEETWRRAIGDRAEEDEDSPYNLKNCGLPVCCADISEARDILTCCRANNGLIAHDRDELSDLLVGHEFEWKSESPIGKILGQLGIELKELKDKGL